MDGALRVWCAAVRALRAQADEPSALPVSASEFCAPLFILSRVRSTYRTIFMGQVLLAFVLILSQGLQQQPAEAVGKFNHAVELQRKGSLQEAVSEYRALLAAHPNYMEAHANLGVVLAQLGRYEEAVSSYEAALRLAPSLPPLLLNLGIAHYRAGQFEKAVSVFEQLLDKAPDNLRARQLLGLSLVELGRDTEAAAHLEQTLDRSLNDPAILYGMGLSYLRLRRPELKGVIEHLAGIPNGRPASHLLQGQAYLGRFEWERALRELETAAKLNPDLPRLQYSLGIAYYSAHRHKEAITAFEAELRRRPRDFSTLYYLAYIHEAEGNLDAAKQRLDAALKLEPQSSEANLLLGKILVKQGRVAEAVGPFEKAVASDPNDPLKHWQLARAYRQLGRQKDADREFAEVQRLKSTQLKSDRERAPKP